jgi:hypothetical protein
MKLTKIFQPDQYSEPLDSWSTLDLVGKTPVLASLFGDVFFSSTEGHWFLDIVKGNLARPWGSSDSMESELQLPDAQEPSLRASLAIVAVQKGIRLAAGEIYDFVQPPSLGGALDAENLRPMDFVVAINIAGQIHTQIVDLPPGTRVSGLVKSDPER